MNRVRVKRGALEYFRRLARSSPVEIEAYLIGEVISPNLTIIHQFCYPKQYEVQTALAVQWSSEDYKKVRKIAEDKGKRIVGSIHSHPNGEVVLSPDDYKAHFTEGFRVLGVCSANNRKTKVQFWVNDSSLPCSIEYLEK